MWNRIELGDVHSADTELERLRVLLLSLNEKDQKGASLCAIFLRHEQEGGLHCQCIAYLTPGTAVALGFERAAACAAPSKSSLSLFAGPTAAWELL